MKFLKWFFGLFSVYANSFERKVDSFFQNIKSTDNIFSIQKDLLNLMQQNLLAVNIWLEKRFKGYKYLSKRTRRKMYLNAEKIHQKLEEHIQNYPVKDSEIKEMLLKKSLPYPHGDEAKIRYIYQIMSFLRPGLYYNYIKTSSFGKLIRDPDKERLEGDCNQVVTLYAYLYSLKFPLEDLKIKLLPEHVCLHFRDIDIEATSAVFHKYSTQKKVLPITEIISTNLLDLSDFREEAQNISERDMLKSAQLAYAISSLKSVVEENLNIAYKNLGIAALKNHDFETAIFYISKTPDKKMLADIYNNACIYYMDQKRFKKAKFYAEKSKDSQLLKSVEHNEAVYEYNKLLKKVSNVRTTEDAKRKKSVYKKMLGYARKMKDSKLEKDVQEILNQL